MRVPSLGELTRVNDVHSALNPTSVFLRWPRDLNQLCEVVSSARRDGLQMAIAGGRHAMGGQQFAQGRLLIDTRSLNELFELDAERGLVRAGAGIQWPELVRGLLHAQEQMAPGAPRRWAIAQKQTGADALTLGGALSANIHGRG